VIGDTFQFQADGADNPRTGISFKWGQCFHRLGHAQAVSDGGVTGDALGQYGQPLGIGIAQ